MAHEAKELIKAPPTAYRRRDAIARAQYVLPVIAILAVVGFGVFEWLARGETRYTPGSLATVHSQWNHQCIVCHDSSQPLAAHNWFAKATDAGHVADAKCQSCHAGASHHAVQIASEVVGCTACHREHLGTPGRLLAVADSHCTSCHHDLEKHINLPVRSLEGRELDDAVARLKKGNHKGDIAAAIAVNLTRLQNVSGFAITSHPEFRILTDKSNDPGTIAFNHARHLIPGMGTESGKLGPFTLEQISPSDRERYRQPGQKDDAAVVLDCRSCHLTEGQDAPKSPDLAGLPASATRPPRGPGATMAPIVFEQHCQACHPLTIDRAIPGDPKTELLSVRHRQQPKQILDVLRGHYTNLLLKGEWQPKPPLPTATLPGKPAVNKAAAKEIDAKADAAVLGILMAHHEKTVEQKVLGQTTCQKCHPALDPAKGVNQTIAPAEIPAVWFKHARFDHTAHRAVDCRECHEQATKSTASADVLLPGIATCVKCHAPVTGVGQAATGGARHDCITCHTYHGGDQPLHGRGSRARQPAAMNTIEEWIKGTR